MGNGPANGVVFIRVDVSVVERRWTFIRVLINILVTFAHAVTERKKLSLWNLTDFKSKLH